MVKNIKNSLLLCLFCTMLFSGLQGQNILKILEGYGRDSTVAYTADEAQEEAAKLFNIILEPDGEIAAERAEQLLGESQSGIVNAYLCVMLADYAFVNKRDSQGLQYLQRAVKEHDPIRNDSYYKLVFDRSQKQIGESPGKEESEQKSSPIAQLTPTPVKETGDNKDQNEPDSTETVPQPEQEASSVPQPSINYRIQIGAFSVRDNALRKGDFFEKKGYPVDIEIRESSSSSLYLVRIGAYESYDAARKALSDLKMKYPDEEGIVVKISNK
jgi:cell division septation protein DedD